MARIRTIKPSFFTSLTIADLTPEQRLTFIGIWTHVDDSGRAVDDPRLIKAALWPLDDRTAADVEDDLRALTESSLITRYTVSERSYLVVNTWEEHQRISRPTKSTLPPPEKADQTRKNAATTTGRSPHGGLTEDSAQEGKGKEGKGTEGNTTLLTGSAVERASEPAPDFSAWYEHYPRKVGKQAAEKAYLKARKTVTAAQLLLAVRRYAADPNLPEQQFIPHPSKWLNDGRWDDGPLPVRRDTARPGIDDKVRAGMTLAQQLQAEEQAAENQKQIGA